MTTKNSLQDSFKTSIPIFEFFNSLFQMVCVNLEKFEQISLAKNKSSKKFFLIIINLYNWSNKYLSRFLVFDVVLLFKSHFLANIKVKFAYFSERIICCHIFKSYKIREIFVYKGYPLWQASINNTEKKGLIKRKASLLYFEDTRTLSECNLLTY